MEWKKLLHMDKEKNVGNKFEERKMKGGRQGKRL